MRLSSMDDIWGSGKCARLDGVTHVQFLWFIVMSEHRASLQLPATCDVLVACENEGRWKPPSHHGRFERSEAVNIRIN